MTPTRMKEIRWHLTGMLPRGAEIKKEPTDEEVKVFLCQLSASETREILQRPGADNFKTLTDEALARLHAADLVKNPRPGNGRIASSGVIDDWDASEVSRSNSTVDPARVRKDKK